MNKVKIDHPTSPILQTPQVWWLLATGTIVIVPLAWQVPFWLTATAMLALLWRGWLAWRGQALPAKWLLFLIVVTGCFGVYTQYHTLFGQNPGVALLMLFMALKQLEARSPRDGLVVVLLAYFLALAQFFYSQTIPVGIVTAICTMVTTACLLSLSDHRPAPAVQLRFAGTLLLQATPFMLLLFILFPRVQGPLWGLPKDANSALTGLSDNMAPGSISNLSQSDAVAFRVRFPEGTRPPAQAKLYWRGPVLTEFDGRAWRVAKQRPLSSLPYEAPSSGGVDYEITVEPNGKPWLFALEMPGQTTTDGLVTLEYQLLTKEPITARQRYTLRSFPDLQVGQSDPEWLKQKATRLPASANPRIQELARSWRAQAADDRAILRQAQLFFLRQGLTYTLNPPLLGEHTADEFLFDTKQGFCEHFANAFAVAMRAAGVSARVVTGYQGGEINPYDSYLTVHQYDAHAWTEVWLPDTGWLRVDPTAISAPTRIDLNLAASVPAGDRLPLMARLDVTWLRDLVFRWDALNNGWNQWVLGYNPERQRQLLQRLGMKEPDWQNMTATLSGLSGIALLLLTMLILRQRQRLDPASALWLKASKVLAKRGLARHQAEGPSDYARRVATILPQHADDIDALADLYAQLRYGPLSSHASDHRPYLKEMRQHLAKLRS